MCGTGAAPCTQWLAAVVLGGQGRYAAAATLLGELITNRDPVLASLAASTLASHRRQVGGHHAARVLDARALGRLAEVAEAMDTSGDRDGIDLLGARFDALLGLAADALGTGRLTTARRLLDVADGLGDVRWRGQVRLHWVHAEVELAAGRADVALPHAELALRCARVAGAVRHEAKSEMVLAATLAAAGQSPGRARALAMSVLDRAMELGLLPLAWPSALLLADLDPARAHRHRVRAAEVLHCVLQRCDPVAKQLAIFSPWMPTALLQG